jgi:surface protein
MRYVKSKCVNGETVSCNTDSNVKLYNCKIPSDEIKKTRHHTNMSKQYYTRLEDRIKANLKNKACNDRMKVTKVYTFNDKSELQSAVDLWINDNNSAFCDYGDIRNWDTSEIIDMSGLFSNAGSFNENISNWDTSNVTYMGNMFSDASSFNQDLSNWNVGKVHSFVNMFSGASSFNQNISVWNVGENTEVNVVISLGDMFKNATEMINSYSGNSDFGDTPSLGYFNQ